MLDKIDLAGKHPAHRATATGTRADVLSAVRKAMDPLTIAEIADRLSVHPNTVRFHLDVLLANHQVELVASDRQGPGRPPLTFRAVRGMDPSGPRNYQLLAAILTDDLASSADPASRATEVGRAWGARLVDPSPSANRVRAVDRLVGVLDSLGFAPEPNADDDRIDLRHCPFLELVEHRADVVCPMHLGLMQGVMSTLGAPVTVSRLDPFVEPDKCVARLGLASVGERSTR